MTLTIGLWFLALIFLFFIFFFQAEDGIRDRDVTGVQTCALPILLLEVEELLFLARARLGNVDGGPDALLGQQAVEGDLGVTGALELFEDDLVHSRSEERRVGKECRSRWWPYH